MTDEHGREVIDGVSVKLPGCSGALTHLRL